MELFIVVLKSAFYYDWQLSSKLNIWFLSWHISWEKSQRRVRQPQNIIHIIPDCYIQPSFSMHQTSLNVKYKVVSLATFEHETPLWMWKRILIEPIKVEYIPGFKNSKTFTVLYHVVKWYLSREYSSVTHCEAYGWFRDKVDRLGR